ncbi:MULTISPECIES: LOG family protein [Okeania]|uniref:LOG family protein n=1 Tax=Okeania hirsuta TaxID=1458930 RepID=A0A3N6NDV2_9CYAN|nr:MULTISPECIES: LOG family protein [Okeania]NES79407.1 LOG family protein [Okeania sp. SIO1H4]NET23079.1 LOG family protein [Okeania sp. SIO1H5]NET96914.1 LOG family protein [Okeania sp. SIO1H2]RQH13035.1 LOG family protein [Okeania hirsuta]RQH45698.1 LOG family protein [Okeania hirsuta]
MASDFQKTAVESIEAEVTKLVKNLPTLKHEKWIKRSLSTIVSMASEELDRLDWKILAASLQDMEKGFEIFYPYRHIRKITIFGSARTSPEAPEYQMAVNFARRITRQGFMVMTGGGGGIMQAGNEGAGAEKSFGLNIQLPFEKESNPFIEREQKLINFKYFFTRKLFFLRESDALALFPGGFGTLDEAFESLTLTQTGKYGPAPLVLIDCPGGNYWHDWNDFIHKQLLRRGLISPEDPSLYTITDDLEEACQAIANFYRMYHSSRYVGEKFVIRLNSELSEGDVDYLNQEYSDILTIGKIEKSKVLPEELGDETAHLPRLVMSFNQKDTGRLYQMIAQINKMGANTPTHPEHK